MLVSTSCDAFNPAFVEFAGNLVGSDALGAIGPDSAGHVAVIFRNDTIFDEALMQALVADGLSPAIFEDPELRPRVRVRVRITYVNNQQLDLEFNDGSTTVLDPDVDPTTFPDLTRAGKTNFVAQCDVARVELMGLPSIFVPIQFSTIRIDPGDENTPPFRVRVTTAPPQFEQLRPDLVDAQGNTTLQRNLDIRDVPGPANQPNCGSVVTIVLSGTLRLPFVVSEFGVEEPGVLNTDINAFEVSPGRYRLIVAVR